MTINAEEYLAGSSFSAVKVAGNVTSLEGYTVEGDGELFLIGTDLYITNADITAVVSPTACTVTFADGTTLNSTTSLPTSGNILLVGYTREGTTRLATELRNFVAIADTVFTGCSDAYGGALVANEKTTTFAFSGATFHNNNATASGGAFYGPNNYDGERLIFDTNTAATSGGAVDHTAASGELTDVIFRNNEAYTGGALYVRGGALTVTGGTFINNLSTRKDVIGAGAIYQTAGELTLTDCFFDSNQVDTTATSAQARGGAIYISGGVLTISDTVFTDHISNGYGGAINNAATCSIYGGTFEDNYAKTEGGAISNMSVMTIGASEAGNFTVFANNTGRQALFNNSSKSLTIGNVIFSGNSVGAIRNKGAMTVNGIIILATATDIIDNEGTVTIDCDAFLSDTVKIAKVFDTKAAVQLPSAYSLDKTGVDSKIIDNDLYIMQSGLTLTPIVSPNGNIYQITIGDKTWYGSGYTDIATALEAADAGTVVLAGNTHSGATLKIDSGTELTLIGENAHFTGVVNPVTGGEMAWGGAVNNRGTANLSGMTFTGNAALRGGAISNNANAVMTLDNVWFDSNTANGKVGSAINNYKGTVTVTDAVFLNGECCAVYNNGGVKMELSGVYFAGNSDERYGGAIHNINNTISISGATFATSGDSLSNIRGTINFTGKNTINADIIDLVPATPGTINVTGAEFTFANSETINISQLTFTDGNSTIYFSGEAVNFTAAGGQDLSSAVITVADENAKAGTVIAAGVAKYGTINVNLTGNLQLVHSCGVWALAETVTVESNGKVLGKNGSIFSGNASGSFFASTVQQNAGDSIFSEITGEVGGTVIGGQWANGSTGYEYATGGAVTLNLNGAKIGDTSHVYGGGYMYGEGVNGSVDKAGEADMTVDKVTMNLTNATAQGLIFGGIHAREYGFAQVGEVNITVDGGTYGRIHGGGWAEKGAYSVVNSVNINVKSGTVQYIYAGGCNATTEAGYDIINGTLVGSADITINSAATVTYVYLGARYAAGKITGDVTLTVTGADKTAEIRRITGWGSTGMDSSENGNSIVKLETSVDTVYFDYIDKLTINENCTLDIETSASFGENQKIAIDLLTDGLDDTQSWDIITGAGLDDIMKAVGSWSINGVAVDWTDGKLGDAYTLTYNESEDKLTLGLA